MPQRFPDLGPTFLTALLESRSRSGYEAKRIAVTLGERIVRSPQSSNSLATTRMVGCRSLNAVTLRLGLMSTFYTGRAAPPGAALPSHFLGQQAQVIGRATRVPTRYPVGLRTRRTRPWMR